MLNIECRSPLEEALEDLYYDKNDNRVDVALYLMSHGCECRNRDKAELLCVACEWDRLGVVKKLVKKYKVDPNSECDNLRCINLISMCLVQKANCDISEYNATPVQCYTFVSTPTLAQV